MKSKIFVILMSLFTILPMTGCIHNGDGQFAIKNTKTLISYIENSDKASIKNMFAPNIREQVDALDEQIDALCEYWKGEYVSLASMGVGGTRAMSYGVVVDIVDFAYDIKTSESNYRIAVLWYRQDDTDTNNEGIWYLWVDSFADDEEANYKGKWENYNVGITLM